MGLMDLNPKMLFYKTPYVVDYILDMLMEQCGKQSHPCIVMEPKWDSVWDIIAGVLPVFLACASLPEYNLQSLLLCGSGFMHLFLYCICCGHFVCQWPIYSAMPSGDFLRYSWLIFLHLSYYSAKVHTVLSLNVLKISFFVF